MEDIHLELFAKQIAKTDSSDCGRKPVDMTNEILYPICAE